jgi:hypothetical protein
MATNFFFRNIDYSPEQNLLSDLTVEMIKIFGIDVYYIIRNMGNIDELFTEAAGSSFTHAIPIEMYINTYEGFQGQGDILSKFGLNVADKLVLSVARTRFQEDIGNDLRAISAFDDEYSLIRPREGDLVYFPLSNGIFEIKFVEHEKAFYQTGSLQYFELELEKFNYNSELFATGIPQIDAIYNKYSMTDAGYLFGTEDNRNYLITEDSNDLVQESYSILNVMSAADPSSQNQEFQILSDTFTDFTVEDPFSESGVY